MIEVVLLSASQNPIEELRKAGWITPQDDDMSKTQFARMMSKINDDFDWFRSEACHELKRKGDLAFLKELLTNNIIRSFFNEQKYKESLYLLAMLDYLSRIHGVPLCNNFNDIRSQKLAEPVFPLSILIAADVTQDESCKEESIRDAIPEFLRFNIIEGNIMAVDGTM